MLRRYYIHVAKIRHFCNSQKYFDIFCRKNTKFILICLNLHNINRLTDCAGVIKLLRNA